MSAPVKHTCPDINRVIKELRGIQKEAKYGMKEHERNSDDYQRYKDIEWPIDQIINQLEDLRTANRELLEWGEGLENDMDEHREIIDELKVVAQ